MAKSTLMTLQISLLLHVVAAVGFNDPYSCDTNDPNLLKNTQLTYYIHSTIQCAMLLQQSNQYTAYRYDPLRKTCELGKYSLNRGTAAGFPKAFPGTPVASSNATPQANATFSYAATGNTATSSNSSGRYITAPGGVSSAAPSKATCVKDRDREVITSVAFCKSPYTIRALRTDCPLLNCTCGLQLVERNSYPGVVLNSATTSDECIESCASKDNCYQFHFDDKRGACYLCQSKNPADCTPQKDQQQAGYFCQCK